MSAPTFPPDVGIVWVLRRRCGARPSKENAGTVFVMWDASAVGQVHAYAWPLDPAQHELVHVPFEEVSATVAVIRDRMHLSSVAVTVLLR